MLINKLKFIVFQCVFNNAYFIKVYYQHKTIILILVEW